MGDAASPNDDPVLELRLQIKLPEGDSAARVLIHRPICRDADGNHTCGVEVDGIGPPYTRRLDAWGVDSWQAMMLALRSVHNMLSHKIEQGTRFEWCEAPVELSELFQHFEVAPQTSDLDDVD